MGARAPSPNVCVAAPASRRSRVPFKPAPQTFSWRIVTDVFHEKQSTGQGARFAIIATIPRHLRERKSRKGMNGTFCQERANNWRQWEMKLRLP